MGRIKKIGGIELVNVASIDGVDVGGIANIGGQEVAHPIFDIDISSGKTISFEVNLPTGKTVYIDWDDGTPTQCDGDDCLQEVSHIYSSGGTYNCKITGDYAFITQLDNFSTPETDFVGPAGDFIGPMTALTLFDSDYGTGWSGGFADFPAALSSVKLEGSSGITGDLTDLVSNTFTYLSFSDCHNLDISSANMPDCSGNVYLFCDSITALKCDSIIIGMDAAGCTSGGYLWTKNGRTSASDTEAASLVTKGWTLDLGS